MKLVITYKNGCQDVLIEKELDCSVLTLRGHAGELIEKWEGGHKGVLKIDRYNAINLGEVVSIRIIV